MKRGLSGEPILSFLNSSLYIRYLPRTHLPLQLLRKRRGRSSSARRSGGDELCEATPSVREATATPTSGGALRRSNHSTESAVRAAMTLCQLRFLLPSR